MDKTAGVIRFAGTFTKTHQQQVTRYALRRAREVFSGEGFESYAIYKHHLFGALLEDWIREVEPSVAVYQPDTGITALQKFMDVDPYAEEGVKNLLVTCSNEVGDIIYESLIKTADTDAKIILFSKNTYLSAPFNSILGDYQTVHGSADDLLENNRLDDLIPYATFFIAAEIATFILDLPDMNDMMDKAIIDCRRISLKNTYTIEKHIFSHFQIERS